MASFRVSFHTTTHQGSVSKGQKERDLLIKGFCKHKKRVEKKNLMNQWQKIQPCPCLICYNEQLEIELKTKKHMLNWKSMK